MKYRVILGLAVLLALSVAPVTADTDEDLAKAERYLQDEDYKNAFKAFRGLARQGSFRAQFVLAGLYADGKGTKQDALEGYGWSALAAESKNAEYVSYSEALLAGIEDQKTARYKAEKLRDKYGVEAQFERAQRTAMRQYSRSKCTGSRLGCGNTNTQVYSTPMTENQTAPQSVASEGGN